jgi:hypothetical protein
MKPSAATDIMTTPEEPETAVLDDLLSVPVGSDAPASPTHINGVVVGSLVGLTADGALALVTYPNQPRTAALSAESMVDLQDTDIGRRVVMAFVEGNATRPIVLGLLKGARADAASTAVGQIDVEADGERTVIAASRQLVLRCGKASITLTCEGKVLVHGTYVSNRSSGVMRIKGGSVQIN